MTYFSQYQAYTATAERQIPPPHAVSRFKSHGFDLIVKKQTRTLKIDHTSGRVIKNLFAQRSRPNDYGIVSTLFCKAVVRHKQRQPATLLRILEDTIECETQADNTGIDIYFSWEGMLGTTTDDGAASFNFSLMIAHDNDLDILSRADGISSLGAKSCKGRLSLKDHLVPRKGSRVTFIVHREIRLHSGNADNAVAEIHFEKPESNFFKIITKSPTVSIK